MYQDSLLFDVGFNTCDISKFESLLSNNFEFFHDKSGISNRSKFLVDIKNGLCSNPANYQSRRALINKSSKVYALYNNGVVYGAIQEGVHQFYEKQVSKPEQFGSSAKFTHVWIIENGEWKLVKSLSYEHKKVQLKYN